MTSGMLTAGTSRYTRAHLADEMSRLKISGGLLSFETTKANLEAAIALAGHVLREASFPEAEFVRLRKQMLAGLEAGRNDPGTLASKAMALHFNRYPAGDFRAAESVEESIAGINAVTLADIKAFYAQFYGASKGELAIVGDFEPDAVTGQIERAFSGWLSAAPYMRMTPIYSEIEPTRKTIDTPDKESGSYLARLNLLMNEDDKDYAALLVANYLFGGGAWLDSRLMQRIRQKDGLSYGVNSQLSINTFNRDGRFVISATAAPQNMARVEAAVREELLRAAREGFSDQEVARAQSGITQQRLQARTRDSNLANGWVQNMYFKRSYQRAELLDEKIAKVTAAEVSAAFAKYIQAEKLTVVIAMDETKAGAATASDKTTPPAAIAN